MVTKVKSIARSCLAGSVSGGGAYHPELETHEKWKVGMGRPRVGAGAGACRSDEKMSRGGGGHVQ